ncbi:hypothetical protein MHY1_00728 [Methylovirgula sp. HY1]|nr:hypothetical protein MHY1_00728 [Methylovirgula sp. HY1]
MEDAGLSRAQRIVPAQISSRLQMARAPALRTVLLWLGCLSILVATTVVSEALQMKLRGDSGAEVVFDSAHDGCAAEDMPDINARAFRNAQGDVVMFALYDMNRALRGKDLAHLKLDCHVVLASHFDPDPTHYDDRNFLTATWTTDGRNVAALVHHEYHADLHGRCTFHTDLACWYNTVVAYQSKDGGANFVKSHPLVVAAAPFRQDVGQGRHRGFFNPSNIFSDGTYEYFFAGTTGWDGQAFGACLFRSATPENSASWRAYDGHAFSIRYDDPYAPRFNAPQPCAAISPFAFPVGAVVRVHGSGVWIAVFQASQNAGAFPVDGFYYATGKDLLHWSAPHLLLAGKTLFSNLCTAGPSIIAYPSLLDPTAKGRNFDDVGHAPFLYYAKIDVAKCGTGRRRLVRQKLTITGNADRHR